MIFGHFSEIFAIFYGKTALSPSILASTKKFSITVNILGKLKSREFRWSWTKIKDICPSVAHSPKMAKIWDEPQRTTCTMEKKYFWCGSNGNVVAQGVLVICPIEICGSKTKSWLFALSYQNFGVPGGPAGQCFFIGSWYENTKTFAPNIGLTIVGWLSTMLLCLILTVWLKPTFGVHGLPKFFWVELTDSCLTFSGFVQLSKMWWGTKTCWLNDWSDWLRRGGALGQRGCGVAGYWLEVFQHFQWVMKLQIT